MTCRNNDCACVGIGASSVPYVCVVLFWRGFLAKLQQLPANQVSDCTFYFYNFNMQYTFTGYRGKITENIQCSWHSCAKS